MSALLQNTPVTCFIGSVFPLINTGSARSGAYFPANSRGKENFFGGSGRCSALTDYHLALRFHLQRFHQFQERVFRVSFAVAHTDLGETVISGYNRRR